MARPGIVALACLAVCLAASLRPARADIVVAPVLTSDGVRDCSYTCDQEGGYNSVNGGNSDTALCAIVDEEASDIEFGTKNKNSDDWCYTPSNFEDGGASDYHCACIKTGTEDTAFWGEMDGESAPCKTWKEVTACRVPFLGGYALGTIVDNEVCVGTVFSDGSWGQVMQTVNTKDANDLYVSQLCTP